MYLKVFDRNKCLYTNVKLSSTFLDLNSDLNLDRNPNFSGLGHVTLNVGVGAGGESGEGSEANIYNNNVNRGNMHVIASNNDMYIDMSESKSCISDQSYPSLTQSQSYLIEHNNNKNRPIHNHTHNHILPVSMRDNNSQYITRNDIRELKAKESEFVTINQSPLLPVIITTPPQQTQSSFTSPLRRSDHNTNNNSSMQVIYEEEGVLSDVGSNKGSSKSTSHLDKEVEKEVEEEEEEDDELVAIWSTAAAASTQPLDQPKQPSYYVKPNYYTITSSAATSTLLHPSYTATNTMPIFKTSDSVVYSKYEGGNTVETNSASPYRSEYDAMSVCSSLARGNDFAPTIAPVTAPAPAAATTAVISSQVVKPTVAVVTKPPLPPPTETPLTHAYTTTETKPKTPSFTSRSLLSFLPQQLPLAIRGRVHHTSAAPGPSLTVDNLILNDSMSTTGTPTYTAGGIQRTSKPLPSAYSRSAYDASSISSSRTLRLVQISNVIAARKSLLPTYGHNYTPSVQSAAAAGKSSVIHRTISQDDSRSYDDVSSVASAAPFTPLGSVPIITNKHTTGTSAVAAVMTTGLVQTPLAPYHDTSNTIATTTTNTNKQATLETKAYMRQLLKSTGLSFRSIAYPGRPAPELLLLEAAKLGTPRLSIQSLLQQVRTDQHTAYDAFEVLYEHIAMIQINEGIDLNINKVSYLIEFAQASVVLNETVRYHCIFAL